VYNITNFESAQPNQKFKIWSFYTMGLLGQLEDQLTNNFFLLFYNIMLAYFSFALKIYIKNFSYCVNDQLKIGMFVNTDHKSRLTKNKMISN